MDKITLHTLAPDDNAEVELDIKLEHIPEMVALPESIGTQPGLRVVTMDPGAPNVVYEPAFSEGELIGWQRYENLNGKRYVQVSGHTWPDSDCKWRYFVGKTPVYRSPDRPAIVKGHHLTFLDELRLSARINMLGAGKHLVDAYSLNAIEARAVLVYWMETFGGDLR